MNSTFLPRRPVHDAVCDSSWTTVAVTVVFYRNEISSSLAIFEMCHLDYCAQSCAELFFLCSNNCVSIYLALCTVLRVLFYDLNPFSEKGFYRLC